MKKEELLNLESLESATEKLNTETEKDAVRAPDKSDYMKRILALPPEDQAFLDGYLFAKLTAIRPA